MEWTRSDEDLLVRIDPGEEIHASLQKLADEAVSYTHLTLPTAPYV